MQKRDDVLLAISTLFDDLDGTTTNEIEAIFIIARLEDDLILFIGFERRISNRLVKLLRGQLRT